MAVAIEATPPTISTRNFTYTTLTRTFTAEASDLSFIPGAPVIVLYNPRTGNKRGFVYTGPERDPEGEVVASTYRSALDGLTVRIWND